MHSSPKSAKSAIRAFAFLLAAGAAGAYGPAGEAWLDALRDRIASGRGGEEAYLEALRMLAADPDGDCGDWIAGGAAEADADPAWSESLRAACPEAGNPEAPDADTEGPAAGDPGSASAGMGPGPAPRRPARGPALDLSASQAARPRGDGPSAARWSARARAAGASLEVSGRGREARRRSARIAGRGWAAEAGHLGRALEPTRIACVAGNAAYAAEGGRSGIPGPLATGYPGLDGLALTAGRGPWRAQAAGAWNRLADGRDPGNPSVTVRRDAGLLAAGLAHASSGGPEIRAQALIVRLETGTAPPAWLAVAGAQWAGRAGAWSWRAAAAGSAGPGTDPCARLGAYGEASLAFRDPEGIASPEWDAEPDPAPVRWRLRLRQAGGGWADPLQSPRGNLRDTVGGWAAAAPDAGGVRAESSFPLLHAGAYAAGVRAAAAAEWAGTRPDPAYAGTALEAGKGEAAWIQTYGPFACTLGAGLGWRRPGSGMPAADGWRVSLQWRRDPWRAAASLARRGSEYAGGRPMPLELSLARASAPGKAAPAWFLAWSAADARRPARAQRADLRQSWPIGRIRVEQRVRVPWTPEGVAADMAYQLGMEAEF